MRASKRPNGHDYYEEEDRDREESSTTDLRTLAVADQHKIGEMEGGGEESEVIAGEVPKWSNGALWWMMGAK